VFVLTSADWRSRHETSDSSCLDGLQACTFWPTTPLVGRMRAITLPGSIETEKRAGPSGIQARATRVAGIFIAAVALVKIICWSLTLYLGATHSGEVLAQLPRGISRTVVYEVAAFPFAPLTLLQGVLAIPLLRGSKRFCWATITVQSLFLVSTAFVLRLALRRVEDRSTIQMAVGNFILALLPVGILSLLLIGHPTHARLRLASAGIVAVCLVWGARLLGLF
jgi:hypothetical protein